MTIPHGEQPRLLVLAQPSLFREAMVSALRGHGLEVDARCDLDRAPVTTAEAVLLECTYPSGDLAGVVARLRSASPGARILLLVDREDRAADRLCRALRADGWVSHESSLDELVSALGRTPGAIPRPRCGESVAPASTTLTPREIEILQVVAAGLSDAATAARLEISVHTVRTHLQSARLKLGADNRFAAVALARRAGSLDPR